MAKTIEEELDALYREIPQIQCKKLCAEACGPIGMTTLEIDRIEKLRGTIPGTRKMPLRFMSGQTVDTDAVIIDCLTCPMLRDGLCSVYKIRPLICRVWGVVQAMPCPHGCKPTRWLSPRESHKLFVRAKQLSKKWERKNRS